MKVGRLEKVAGQFLAEGPVSGVRLSGQPVASAFRADLGREQGGECKLGNRPNAHEGMEHDIHWNPDRSEWICARCRRTSDHTHQRDAEIEIMQFKCVPQPNTPQA